MRKLILLIAITFTSVSMFAQTVYREIDGPDGEKRQLKIQVPRNYEKNVDTMYPVIVVFDGDYLFEPVAGIADYYSYWDEMPDAIVVGINQSKTKAEDFACDEINGLPSETGAAFFEFISYDLFNFIDNNYRTVPFRTIVGHGDSANFLNFYLFQEKPFFNSYISLSPSFTPKMELRLKEQFTDLQTPIYYSLTTAEDDRKRSKTSIGALNKSLEAISNDNFDYNYNYYKGKSHYELVNHAIPTAFEKIYKIYKPIDRKEYKEKMLTIDEGTAYDYLVKKYDTIKSLYGLDKQIRINDFNAAEAALKKTEEWEAFKLLGKLAKEEYPESMLGMYYMGIHYENIGEPKKAIKAYQSGFIMNEVGRLTKDDMLHYAELIKADFGLK
jgi:predicted alpha/beta superfamily hydrolase